MDERRESFVDALEVREFQLLQALRAGDVCDVDVFVRGMELWAYDIASQVSQGNRKDCFKLRIPTARRLAMPRGGDGAARVYKA